MSALPHRHQTCNHGFRAKAVGTPTGVPGQSTVTPGGDTPQSQSRPAQSLVPEGPECDHVTCRRGHQAEPLRLHPVPTRPRHSQLPSALTAMLSPFLRLEKLFYQCKRSTEERGNGPCFPAHFPSVRGKLAVSEGLWREAGSRALICRTGRDQSCRPRAGPGSAGISARQKVSESPTLTASVPHCELTDRGPFY